MAGLRVFRCYRKVKRAYTRKSKFKKKNYIRSLPDHRIARFEMGNQKRNYNYKIKLVSKGTLQIRHNAIESSRLVINTRLQKWMAPNYFFKLNKYPHHALRENRILSGGHVDRIQTGMGHPFGKVISVAVQLREGQTLFTAFVDKENIEKAKVAFNKARPRLPGQYNVVVEENTQKFVE